MSEVPASLRATVRERAKGCCEYCRVPEGLVLFSHEPDHIIASQHGGETTAANLALACMHCNRRKGPNIASVDPQTSSIVPLFNPRADRWDEHFRIEGHRIIALTAQGRATATLLKFDAPERVVVRYRFWQAGKYPPSL
jgi:hypothetical protein